MPYQIAYRNECSGQKMTPPVKTYKNSANGTYRDIEYQRYKISPSYQEILEQK
jgi:hypothetical protein